MSTFKTIAASEMSLTSGLYKAWADLRLYNSYTHSLIHSVTSFFFLTYLQQPSYKQFQRRLPLIVYH